MRGSGFLPRAYSQKSAAHFRRGWKENSLLVFFFLSFLQSWNTRFWCGDRRRRGSTPPAERRLLSSVFSCRRFSTWRVSCARSSRPSRGTAHTARKYFSEWTMIKTSPSRKKLIGYIYVANQFQFPLDFWRIGYRCVKISDRIFSHSNEFLNQKHIWYMVILAVVKTKTKTSWDWVKKDS